MISRRIIYRNLRSHHKGALELLMLAALLLCVVDAAAQDSKHLKQQEKAIENSLNLTFQGNSDLLQRQDDIQAEMAYRRAISENDSNSIAKYNLGNLYYNNNSMGEAFMRYKEAGLSSRDKAEKHKAYHNLGNVFMKNKEFSKAVEAYKEALRNDPTDDQTRYNLALAKQKRDNEQNQNQDNQDQNDEDNQKDQNQDNKDQNQDNKQNDQDKKDDNTGQEKKDEQGDQKDKNQPEDQGQQQPQDNKPDQGDKQPSEKPQENQQPPRPNQLSPQQIKNILEAMNNEEKKVRERINAEQVKGKPIKNEKDW